jgi:hypothetical protein
MFVTNRFTSPVLSGFNYYVSEIFSVLPDEENKEFSKCSG